MKIRRSRPSIEWTQIPNVVVRDYRISWRARGLLVELLSYPPGWETTIDELVRRAQRQAERLGGQVEGRDAMRAAARELKKVGYLVAHKHQDERGRWHTDMEVTDAPLWELLPLLDDAPAPDSEAPDPTHDDVSAGRTDDGFPGVGSPGVGSPAVGSPGVSIKKEKKKERKKETDTPPPPAPPRDRADSPLVEEGEEGKRREETAPPPDDAVAWVEALPWKRRPGRQQRERLAVLVAAAQAAGWAPEALRRELLTELEGVRSLYAVWKTRLSDLGLPPAPSPVSVDLRPTEAPSCPRHPGRVRRPDGECAGCWVDRMVA